jgi:hypothetical protein
MGHIARNLVVLSGTVCGTDGSERAVSKLGLRKEFKEIGGITRHDMADCLIVE